MQKRKISLKNSIFIYITGTIIVMVFLFLSSSLIVYNNSTKKNAKLEAKEISNQIGMNFENYLNTIFTTFSYFEVEIINNEDATTLKNKFEISCASRNDINTISIFDDNLNCIVSTGDLKVEANFLNQIKENESIYNFSKPYTNNQNYAMQIGKFINMSSFSPSKTTMLVVEINFQNLVNISNNSNLGENGSILILDNNYNDIFTTTENDNITKKKKDIIKELIIGNDVVKINKTNYIVNSFPLSKTRWTISVFINVEQYYRSQIIYNLSIILISSLVIVFSIFASSIIAKRVSTPLKQLEKTMKEIEKGNFDVSIEMNPTKTQLEVLNLSNNFMVMIQKIRELMDNLLIEQRSKRTSELKALQNQINPHFLYNTLDSIVYLAEKKQNDDVVTMVVSLAKFFRISISKGRTQITVKEELEHVKNYMVIQKIRYKDKFVFFINADEKLLNLSTMKLLLQPFVENSIYHGLKNLDDVGIINISCYADDNYLYYEIKDNGLGMKQDKIDELYLNMRNNEIKNSVGIKNVYQRIKLYYGEGADIIIESVLDEYTKITIKIPLGGMINE